MIFRGIPATAHSAIEVIAAPAIMVAPFVLGFGTAATVLTVAIGALLLTLALQIDSPSRSVPLSAHAGFDYTLAFAAAVGGAAVGFISGELGAAIFLVGVGAAMALLTVSTRFTMARNA